MPARRAETAERARQGSPVAKRRAQPRRPCTRIRNPIPCQPQPRQKHEPHRQDYPLSVVLLKTEKSGGAAAERDAAGGARGEVSCGRLRCGGVRSKRGGNPSRRACAAADTRRSRVQGGERQNAPGRGRWMRACAGRCGRIAPLAVLAPAKRAAPPSDATRLPSAPRPPRSAGPVCRASGPCRRGCR